MKSHVATTAAGAALLVRLLVPAALGFAVEDPGLRASLITEAEALENFNFVWEKVRDTHFDEDLNGVDWPAVRDEFRPRAAACGNITELRVILRQAVARLGQSHFGIVPSGDYLVDHATGLDARIERVFAAVPGHVGRPGVGIDVRVMEGRIVVTDVLESGSAHGAGVRPGWVVESTDGHPMTELDRRLRETGELYADLGASFHAMNMCILVGELLAGDVGSSVRVVFRDHEDKEVALELVRRPVPWDLSAVGGMPPLPVRVESRYLDSGAREKIGYIKIHYVWLPETVGAFEKALVNVKEAEALILDLRGNLGGVGLAAQGVAGYLTAEQFSFGTSVGRHGEISTPVFPRTVDSHGKVFEPMQVPIALLIDSQTGSSSELFSAGLQDAGIARLFGEPTAGAALPATITPMPNGDKLLHAVYDFVRANGERIEDSPVQPDTFSKPTREDWIAGNDRALDAAVEWARERVVISQGGHQ
jgi:carboxyl-terminal processing protease